MRAKSIKAKPKRPKNAMGAAVIVAKIITGEIEEEPTTRFIVEVVPEPPPKK